MGEMINNIAHQYRQPLTHLGYILMNIKSAFEHGELDKEYLNKKINQGNSQLLFLSKTIDSFRDFYKPNYEKEKFFLSNSIQEAISIIKPILQENKIELKVDLDDEVEVLGFENEYSQVVLNLLSNAKDALIENEIKNPIIEIFMIKKDLYIKDNAKGVPTELEEKIFQPYFSTKDKSSGIGLYMSSLIIQEHFNGKLSLENSLDGATFIIKL
jgi:signal transduction histidine kinase